MAAPNRPISRHPMEKLRCRKTRRSTSGCLWRNSRMRNDTKLVSKMAAAQRIQVAPNQSGRHSVNEVMDKQEAGRQLLDLTADAVASVDRLCAVMVRPQSTS